MALYLTSLDAGCVTFTCCDQTGGCGRVLEGPEVRAADIRGTVYLQVECLCGAVSTMPRITRADVDAMLADPDVQAGRMLWHRARFDAALAAAPDHAWLRAPCPPGDHSARLADLWDLLDDAGWPHQPDVRHDRHRQLLDRWPIHQEGD